MGKHLINKMVCKYARIDLEMHIFKSGYNNNFFENLFGHMLFLKQIYCIV